MRIILVCNAGMSTGILKAKLERAAFSRELPVEIKAVSYNDIERHYRDSDVLALGPQMKLHLRDIQDQTNHSIAIMLIPPLDFGIMNAEKILDDIIVAFHSYGNK